MTWLWGLAWLETLLMGVVVVGGVLRWRWLDRGARAAVAGFAVFLAYVPISAVLVAAHRSTRLPQELPFLLSTVLFALGCAWWQPKRWQRLAVLVGTGLFVALWSISQWVQGATGQFSTISVPIAAATITAAAGFTVVNRVRVTHDRWTGQLWYWFCIGLMVAFGAEVLFEPALAEIAPGRKDLVALMNGFRLAAAIIGYCLVARGVWGVGRSIRVTGAFPISQPASRPAA